MKTVKIKYSKYPLKFDYYVMIMAVFIVLLVIKH